MSYPLCCRPKHILTPNIVTLSGQSWTPLPSSENPVYIVPQSVPAGVIYFRRRGEPMPATSAACWRGYGGKLGPGDWDAYYDLASATLKVALIDAFIGEQTLDGYTLPAHNQVTLSTGSAQTLLAANILRRFALVQNNGAIAIRLRWDGTNPSASSGIRLEPGDSLAFEGDQLYRGAIVGIEESGSVVVDLVEGV